MVFDTAAQRLHSLSGAAGGRLQISSPVPGIPDKIPFRPGDAGWIQSPSRLGRQGACRQERTASGETVPKPGGSHTRIL